MNKKRIIGFCALSLLIAGALIMSADFGESAVISSNPRNIVSSISQQFGAGTGVIYSREDLNTYWPALTDREQCEARQDFILSVAPGGCQPAVVRSDLLAEQNVPVFCQISALKLNPLIEVDEIRNIRFSGQYPKEVVGSGFHPAKAALRTRDKLLGSPVINNIGYAVVVLKKTEKEEDLPDKVNLTLSAKIDYESGNAFGIGESEFVLRLQDDEEWTREQDSQTFWQGRYSVRLEEADPGFAVVSIYSGNNKVATTRVARGKSSEPIYVPGTYCRAGLEVNYAGLESAQKSARLEIDGDKFDVYEGQKIINNKCTVSDININEIDGTGNVRIDCRSQIIRLEIGQNLATRTGDDILVGDVVPANSPGLVITDPKYDGVSVNIRNVRSTTELNNFLNGLSQNFGQTAQGKIAADVCEVHLKSENLGGNRKTGYYSIVRKSLFGFDGDWTLSYRETQTKLYDSLEDKGLEGDDNLWKRNLKNELILKCEGKSDSDILKEKEYDTNTEQAFREAIEAYEEVAEEYTFEKDIEQATIPGTESYGEIALKAAVDLAASFDKRATQANLMREFVEKFPESELVSYYEAEIGRLYSTDYSDSRATIEVDNKFRDVKLISFDVPEKEEALAEFSLGGSRVSLGNLEEYEFTNKGIKGILRVKTIKDVDQVGVQIICDDENAQFFDDLDGISLERDRNRYYFNQFSSYVGSLRGLVGRTLRVGGDSVDACGLDLSLEDVEIKKVARIRLEPRAQGTETETNFSVNIGIEKRAIQLSPEKTKETIDNLNKTIEKWEGLSNNLGNVVKGLKGACFATSAVLTAKNFLSGLDGQAIARQKVMTGDNGWGKICEDAYKDKRVLKSGHTTYNSVDDCLRQNSNDVNKDVAKMQELVKEVNDKVGNIEEGNNLIRDDGVFGKVVDTDKSGDLYWKQVYSKIEKSQVNVDIIENGEKKTVRIQDLVKDSGINGNAWNNSLIRNYDDMRDIDVYTNIIDDPGASETLRNQAREILSDRFSDLAERSREQNEKGAFASALNKAGVENYRVYESDLGNKFVLPYNGVGISKNLKDAGIVGDYGELDSVQFIRHNGVKYGVVLSQQGKGEFDVKDVYKIEETNGQLKANKIEELTGVRESRKTSDQEAADQIQSFRFLRLDSASYRNKILNPEVRYFETEPYKGMPALVPFDLQNGWYAGVKQSLPVFGNGRAYDSSGKVASFWICNVGQDQRIDFDRSGFGDDTCQQFNLYAGQSKTEFPGLSERESSRLVKDAEGALNEAARQYKSGVRFVRVGRENIPVGSPAIDIPGTRCQDFMSPEECQLLFNVCDPVICPSSRCDLGGTYRVASVQETGIIGSIALCLPNWKEGIYVPVCLTGVKAGIDGYVSILQSHRACLQESLDTGKTVGTCDLINSVYMCEFFWRQIAPVANIILPKLVEVAYGQGARGGGEYLSVMAAWENAEQSIEYFTQSYGASAWNSFRARNIEEAGGQFCKAFVSSNIPTSFETLLEPDSPPQFHAWFDSTRFSDATVPATAQYKVFYHIFAGQDSGTHYSVYLKNPPESSFVSISPTLHVATGFIPRGEFATETADFTAPEGYKELCVRINDREECGFKQVSTSFAVNYVRDKIVQDELLNKDITSEKECISGEATLAAGLNPNLGAALGEVADPAIYNRGISRICGTENPGKGTDGTRFVEVGYCDDKRVKCWLDTESVDNAITDNNIGLKNKTLNVLAEENRALLTQRGLILSEQEVRTNVKSLRARLQELKRGYQNKKYDDEYLKSVDILLLELGKIDIDEVPLNYQKADLVLLRGNLNEEKAIYSRGQQTGIVQSVAEGGTAGIGTTDSTDPGTLDIDERDIADELEAGNDLEEGSTDEEAVVLPDSVEAIIAEMDAKNIETIGLRYLEGYDDLFAFRWNEQQKKPEVYMKITESIAGIPVQDTLDYDIFKWNTDPNLVNWFEDERGIYSYEKSDVNYIMGSNSWGELIKRVTETKIRREDNVEIFFPKTQDSTKIFDDFDEGLADEFEQNLEQGEGSSLFELGGEKVIILERSFKIGDTQKNYLSLGKFDTKYFITYANGRGELRVDSLSETKGLSLGVISGPDEDNIFSLNILLSDLVSGEIRQGASYSSADKALFDLIEKEADIDSENLYRKILYIRLGEQRILFDKSGFSGTERKEITFESSKTTLANKFSFDDGELNYLWHEGKKTTLYIKNGILKIDISFVLDAEIGQVDRKTLEIVITDREKLNRRKDSIKNINPSFLSSRMFINEKDLRTIEFRTVQVTESSKETAK